MKYAVVDSGPLIKGVRLELLRAERLVTVPQVLSEIRDKHARQMLEALPVELETREPSDEAIDAIRKFAKLTGDLPVLSAVDVSVLALAWMLEKETKNGVSHLRVAPQPVAASRPRRDAPESDAASSSVHGVASNAHGHSHDHMDVATAEEAEEEAAAAAAAEEEEEEEEAAAAAAAAD